MELVPARIRPVRRDDGAKIAAFYAALSSEARRSRFFGACRSISQAQAERFARASEHHAHGWVAVDGRGTVIGHLCLEPCGGGGEEIGVAVGEGWRGRGLGRALVDAAISSARDRGVASLEASMLTGNQAIHALLEGTGWPWVCRGSGPGTESIRIDLAPALPGAA